MNLIPALQVVVTRPKDLTYQDLREIRLRLKENKFEEKALQDAWRQEKKEYYWIFRRIPRSNTLNIFSLSF